MPRIITPNEALPYSGPTQLAQRPYFNTGAAYGQGIANAGDSLARAVTEAGKNQLEATMFVQRGEQEKALLKQRGEMELGLEKERQRGMLAGKVMDSITGLLIAHLQEKIHNQDFKNQVEGTMLGNTLSSYGDIMRKASENLDAKRKLEMETEAHGMDIAKSALDDFKTQQTASGIGANYAGKGYDAVNSQLYGTLNSLKENVFGSGADDTTNRAVTAMAIRDLKSKIASAPGLDSSIGKMPGGPLVREHMLYTIDKFAQDNGINTNTAVVDFARDKALKMQKFASESMNPEEFDRFIARPLAMSMKMQKIALTASGLGTPDGTPATQGDYAETMSFLKDQLRELNPDLAKKFDAENAKTKVDIPARLAPTTQPSIPVPTPEESFNSMRDLFKPNVDPSKYTGRDAMLRATSQPSAAPTSQPSEAILPAVLGITPSGLAPIVPGTFMGLQSPATFTPTPTPENYSGGGMNPADIGVMNQMMMNSFPAGQQILQMMNNSPTTSGTPGPQSGGPDINTLAAMLNGGYA